jgi:hypothetical protein
MAFSIGCKSKKGLQIHSHINHLVLANDTNMSCVAYWSCNCSQYDILLIILGMVTYILLQWSRWSNDNHTYDNNN